MNDSGSYRCEATNDRGVASSSIQLRVYGEELVSLIKVREGCNSMEIQMSHVSLLLAAERGFITLIEVGNDTMYTRAGESLVLRIVLEAYPRPKLISWVYEGQALQNSSDHVISTQEMGYRWAQFITLRFTR